MNGLRALVLLLPVALAADETAARRLEVGIERARGGDFTAAIDDFLAARAASEGALHAIACFDWAKALQERAARRELPPPPPTDARLDPGLAADARSLLSASRGDLTAARQALLEMEPAAEAEDALERQVALAHLSRRLREVEARDALWRAWSRPRSSPSGPTVNPKKPLKEGPSARKGDAGAPGKKGGRADDGEEGAEKGAQEGAGPALSPLPVAFSEEEVSRLAQLLDQVRGELKALDRWRGDAAHDRAASSRQ